MLNVRELDSTVTNSDGTPTEDLDSTLTISEGILKKKDLYSYKNKYLYGKFGQFND